mgnify:CR=1 FL=1|jgi:hypothetical protein
MKKIMFNDRYGLTDAVIEGRKIMTRRLIDPMPKDCATVHKNCWGANWSDEPMSLVVDRDTGGIYCKYCGNGVRLHDGGYHYKTKYEVGEVVAVAQSYEAAGFDPGYCIEGGQFAQKHAGWHNKMFVKPALMSHRIRITGIKCERLQDISDEDCFREGISESWYESTDTTTYGYADEKKGTAVEFDTPRKAFAALIDKVSGRGTWASNPWVVVYEFELVK